MHVSPNRKRIIQPELVKLGKNMLDLSLNFISLIIHTSIFRRLIIHTINLSYQHIESILTTLLLKGVD